MKELCLRIIDFYRKNISPLKPQCCRFYPTCSSYAKQAFIKHGFFWGLVLSVYRVLRCNPFCRHGYDPVPERLFGGGGDHPVNAVRKRSLRRCHPSAEGNFGETPGVCGVRENHPE